GGRQIGEALAGLRGGRIAHTLRLPHKNVGPEKLGQRAIRVLLGAVLLHGLQIHLVYVAQHAVERGGSSPVVLVLAAVVHIVGNHVLVPALHLRERAGVAAVVQIVLDAGQHERGRHGALAGGHVGVGQLLVHRLAAADSQAECERERAGGQGKNTVHLESQVDVDTHRARSGRLQAGVFERALGAHVEALRVLVQVKIFALSEVEQVAAHQRDIGALDKVRLQHAGREGVAHNYLAQLGVGLAHHVGLFDAAVVDALGVGLHRYGLGILGKFQAVEVRDVAAGIKLHAATLHHHAGAYVGGRGRLSAQEVVAVVAIEPVADVEDVVGAGQVDALLAVVHLFQGFFVGAPVGQHIPVQAAGVLQHGAGEGHFPAFFQGRYAVNQLAAVARRRGHRQGKNLRPVGADEARHVQPQPVAQKLGVEAKLKRRRQRWL
nr:hypothetical protein [Tanacetum cinerariifolium]